MSWLWLQVQSRRFLVVVWLLLARRDVKLPSHGTGQTLSNTSHPSIFTHCQQVEGSMSYSRRRSPLASHSIFAAASPRKSSTPSQRPMTTSSVNAIPSCNAYTSFCSWALSRPTCTRDGVAYHWGTSPFPSPLFWRASRLSLSPAWCLPGPSRPPHGSDTTTTSQTTSYTSQGKSAPHATS